MQPRAVLFPHLFCRDNFAAQVGESNKLMLDRLQALVPLSVRDLSLCSIPALAPKLFIQLLNVSDLFPETPDLVPKNRQMIHLSRITDLDKFRVVCPKQVWQAPQEHYRSEGLVNFESNTPVLRPRKHSKLRDGNLYRRAGGRLCVLVRRNHSNAVSARAQAELVG
jgi:hypothetical protein